MGIENITKEGIGVFDLNSLNGSLLKALPPEILAPFEKLMMVLQVVGILFLAYIIFLLIREIFTWRRNKRIDVTYEKILEIDKKLDELLKRTSKKEKLFEKAEKTAGFFARLFGKKDSKIKKDKK